MPKIPVVKGKDFLRALKRRGCLELETNGSHHKVVNPANGRSTTVPVHGGGDLGIGLFAKILRDLDIDAAEFIDKMK